MAKLYISGIECHAFHGCLKEERIIGQKFSVDVIFDVDLKEAILTDDLRKTIDYVAVKDIVLREMKIPSNLIEHVCGKILKSLHSQFPNTKDIIVKVIKFNPPVNGVIKQTAIELSKNDLSII
ncbi:MAG TPA: dihydroneopterin aldolase [Bacteroidia bacterium]|nr:dihydroneopterin aldolase [Bacteroidia bacterium]HNU34887.1 dihydroneopterin aldolase [Bacteroidia bacterium]